MNNLMKRIVVVTPIFILLFFLTSYSLNAQELAENTLTGIKKLPNQNMSYMKDLNKIIRQYPHFSYSYKMNDGKLSSVTLTGIENKPELKRIKVVLVNLKSNENMIKSKANRLGVFYTVDKFAHYKGGQMAFDNQLHNNLTYPQDAKNWGVQGTIYVKFVVDANGKIPFITTSDAINPREQPYVKDLESQAVDAVKSTSGHWNAGEVNGVKVPSLVSVPITFDIKPDPDIPAMIE